MKSHPNKGWFALASLIACAVITSCSSASSDKSADAIRSTLQNQAVESNSTLSPLPSPSDGPVVITTQPSNSLAPPQVRTLTRSTPIDLDGKAISNGLATDGYLTLTDQGYRIGMAKNGTLQTLKTPQTNGRILAASVLGNTVVIATEFARDVIEVTVARPNQAPLIRQVVIPNGYSLAKTSVAQTKRNLAIATGLSATSGSSSGLTIYGSLKNGPLTVKELTPPGPIVMIANRVFYGGPAQDITDHSLMVANPGNIIIIPEVLNIKTGQLKPFKALQFKGTSFDQVDFDVLYSKDAPSKLRVRITRGTHSGDVKPKPAGPDDVKSLDLGSANGGEATLDQQLDSGRFKTAESTQ